MDDELPKPLRERILELEEIEDELREVAEADVPYSPHAQNFLDALEEARQDDE